MGRALRFLLEPYLSYVVAPGRRGAQIAQVSQMTQNHTISHVEYVSEDAAATTKFFETLFGWTLEAMPDGYAFGAPPGGATVGLRGPQSGESPASISYVQVKNVKAALASAEKAGAKVVVHKTEIPNFGHFGIIIAPGSVALGLFEPM